MTMTLKQAAKQVNRRLDQSGKFRASISENIYTDEATGARLCHVVGETLVDRQGISQELHILIHEFELTDTLADTRTTDAITSFDAR